VRDKKVIVVMPAYNAEKTLERTLDDIPREWVDEIILTDDASRDGTVALAKRLGLRVFVHEKNRGYGANQKTCYREALRLGGDIMVMIHPDHQYDPKVIPGLIRPLLDGECDAVFGSRMLGGRPLEGGMPKWKYLANLFLTALENAAFYMYLTEYHSGLRAYSRRYLETVSFELNSDDFVFDSEIIAQGVVHNLRIKEIPIETRYFEEASKIGFLRSLVYGFAILRTLLKFKLHKGYRQNAPIPVGPPRGCLPRLLVFRTLVSISFRVIALFLNRGPVMARPTFFADAVLIRVLP
jgi:glycosyltransferase involved in cell wall biosynthesis